MKAAVESLIQRAEGVPAATELTVEEANRTVPVCQSRSLSRMAVMPSSPLSPSGRTKIHLYAKPLEAVIAFIIRTIGELLARKRTLRWL